MPSTRIWIWLAVALGLGVILVGSAFYFTGIKFFRNIEHAEMLLYAGWAVVGIVGVIIPVLIKAFRNDRRTQRSHDRR